MRFYRRMRTWRHVSALIVLALSCLAFAGSSADTKAAGKKYLVYIGTYTQDHTNSKGIYAYRFDPDHSKIEALGVAAETINPSFVAMSPSHRFLYAVNELQKYDGQSSGGVSAFSIDAASGKLTFLNEVASGGADPCYITVDQTGKYVLVANYTGGSVAVFSVEQDGRLGPRTAFVQHTGHGTNPERQEGPHAHSINLSPNEHFAFVDDLGLDQLKIYRFDREKGTLTPSAPPFVKIAAGSGPRHFALTPNHRFAYVISEMKSTVTALRYTGGNFQELQTISTLPPGFTGHNDDAEIEVHPSGRFLYGSNRGADSITVFAIHPSGKLSVVEYVSTQGKTPRSFGMDPTGHYLFAANMDSNNIVIFRIDQTTGKLTATGQVLDVPSPVCVKFVAEN